MFGSRRGTKIPAPIVAAAECSLTGPDPEQIQALKWLAAAKFI
jgi:hypothetical protein